MVKWNEPYQKLASCDSTGIIFVWIKYEGRWSIELINDRNTPVTSFSWSHDGRMALICYQVQYWTNFHFLLPLDFHKEFMNIYNLHKISISWKRFTLNLLNYIFSGESLSQLEFHFHNHGILKPGILFNFLSSPLWSSQEDYAWLRCLLFQDGFVLVGSVAGQRYWSTMLPPEVTVTCGTWSPDDQLVYIGTGQGGLVVMDVHGNIVNKVSISLDTGITDLQWSCEKFVMEEREQGGRGQETVLSRGGSGSRDHTLAICFKNGDIKLVSGYDDVSPTVGHNSPILKIISVLLWWEIILVDTDWPPDYANRMVQFW